VEKTGQNRSGKKRQKAATNLPQYDAFCRWQFAAFCRPQRCTQLWRWCKTGNLPSDIFPKHSFGGAKSVVVLRNSCAKLAQKSRERFNAIQRH
jgi:hypothetical protein